RSLGRAERLADGLERRRILIVAVDVAQQVAELVERRAVDPAVLVEAVLGAGAELLEVPTRLGDADDRRVEVAALHHRLQRGKDFLFGEAARGAKEDEGIRMKVPHPPPPTPPAFPDDRRTRSASPRAACRKSRLRRGS